MARRPPNFREGWGATRRTGLSAGSVPKIQYDLKTVSAKAGKGFTKHARN